jgi:hypothetical protein
MTAYRHRHGGKCIMIFGSLMTHTGTWYIKIKEKCDDITLMSRHALSLALPKPLLRDE